MTIEEMRQKKREKGYTYVQIAERSGVPLGTVQKIFCGDTASPRYGTLLALEKVFRRQDTIREAVEEYLPVLKKPGEYTVEDYYALPDDLRMELIDGVFYEMEAPTLLHQRILGEVYRQAANYIHGHSDRGLPFLSPVDVQLDCDEKTIVQPDFIILCDESKIKRRVICGAPEFVLEIVSPTSSKNDYVRKYSKYACACVKEYWVIDPCKERMAIFHMDTEDLFPQSELHSLDESVPVRLYDGELKIDLQEIGTWIRQMQK